MAFDPSPATWLGAGYTLSSSVAGFNTDDAGSDKLLLQLTDALADPTTGDIRDVMMATIEAFYQAWLAQAPADRPTRLTITRSTAGSNPAGTAIFTYVFKCIVDPTTFTITSE